MSYIYNKLALCNFTKICIIFLEKYCRLPVVAFMLLNISGAIKFWIRDTRYAEIN